MLESAFEKMSSKDYLTQIRGIDESLLILDSVFSEIIRIMKESEDSLFISERVCGIFGSLKRKLESLFDETDGLDTKVNIAIIYLTNNDYSKVPFLVDYLSKTSDIGNATFCIMKLASKRVLEVRPLINEWTTRISNDQSLNPIKKRDYLEMLEGALKKLG